uniref:Uncharacterized protein n=1 Tax=Anguilla anguilla TaxID=7936 RepID=A0A0E9U658_ANGAN
MRPNIYGNHSLKHGKKRSIQDLKRSC